MKKSLAALGALIVGAGAAGVAAAPAQAAPADCTSLDQHQISAGDPAAGDWYMDCVPQYGLGKVQFDIASPVPFGQDFSLNDNADVTAIGHFAEDPNGYVGGLRGGLQNLTASTIDAQHQRYTGSALLPITRVEKIGVVQMPADCAPRANDYDAVYRVTYAPSTTTFSTTPAAGLLIDGAPGRFDVTVAPQPLVLGLNFADGGGALDPADPFCASSGDTTTLWTSRADTDTTPDEWDAATEVFAQNGFGGSLAPVSGWDGADRLTLDGSVLAKDIDVPTLSISTPPLTYGRADNVVLNVGVYGAQATGLASLALDGTPIATGQLTAGRLIAALPATLALGTHTIEAAYTGNETTDDDGTDITVTVTKAPTATTVALAKSTVKVKTGSTTLSIKVGAPHTTLTPGGTAKVIVNGKTLKSVAVKNGVAKVTLSGFSKVQTNSVKVVFGGSSKTLSSTSATVKLKVVK